MNSAQALTPQQVHDIVVGETDARIESLQKALTQADASTAVFLQALADDAVVIAGQQVIMVRDGKGTDPTTGQAVPIPANAESVVSNNRMRGEIDSALAALQLLSPDDESGAGAVFNQDLRAPSARQLLRDETCDGIRRGARGNRQHEPHGFGWPALSMHAHGQHTKCHQNANEEIAQENTP